MRDGVKQPYQYYKQHLLKDALFANDTLRKSYILIVTKSCSSYKLLLWYQSDSIGVQQVTA